MKDKFSKKELVGYIISGIIAMFGLVLVILGIVERNMDVVQAKTSYIKLTKKSKLL